MRAAYLAGEKVTATLSFFEHGIEASAIKRLEYELASKSETLVGRTEIAIAPGAESVEVVIDAEHNTIQTGAVRDLRLVRFYVTTDAGVSLTIIDYAIETTSLLTAGANSFQSYEEALLLSYELSDIDHWVSAPRISRINTLSEAYRDIASLRFRFTPVDQARMTEFVNVPDITKLSPSEWGALPSDFKEALCRAQLLQANYSFVMQQVDAAREQGMQSITVGESKNFFNSRRPPSLSGSIVSTRVRKELAKWVYTTNIIGRA